MKNLYYQQFSFSISSVFRLFTGPSILIINNAEKQFDYFKLRADFDFGVEMMKKGTGKK
jgi:hypothetical protein